MKYIFLILFGLMMFSVLASAKTVTEDPTGNLIPMVAYGNSTNGLVPIKVDTDGSVYLH